MKSDIRGKSPFLIVIDDLISIEEMETMRKMMSDDFTDMEMRVLAAMEDMPVKADMGPVVEHDPHPKAKAKMPYYHQRRRY